MAGDTQFITALSRGLQILRCFTPDEPLLTNSALARCTGMPASSISRLTHTLVKAGYLDYDSDAGAYRLGLCVLSLQPAALAGARIASLVAPCMAELASQVRGRVLLTAYENYGLTVIQGACTDPGLPGPSVIGYRYALTRRAMGRACMASSNGSEQESIVAHLAQGDGARSAGVRSELERAVQAWRSDGFCTSMGEARPGNHSISVALNVPHLGRRLFLACGGPADRLPERVLRDRVAPLLMRAAAQIEHDSTRMASRAGDGARHH